MDLEISVDGNPDPVDSEIYMGINETAMLNIYTPTGCVVGDDVYFALVVDTDYGAISGGVLTFDAPADSWIFGEDAQANGMCAAPEDGIWGVIALSAVPGPPGIYIDEVLFRSMSEGDAIINLWTTQDFANFTLEDSVVIHVPEPMTLSLLGLGGLGLLRRRRA